MLPPSRKKKRSASVKRPRRKSVVKPVKIDTTMDQATLKSVENPPEHYVIPDSIRYISPKCLFQASIKFVCISANVEIIGERCFADCKALSEVSFVPANCPRKIGRGAFEGCISLTRFVWPREAADVPEMCFSSCRSLHDFQFEDPNYINQIRASAFNQCVSLGSFVLPPKVSAISEKCFCDCCSLERFEFADGHNVKSIGDSAFYGCEKLSTFVWPRTVGVVPYQCFGECRLLSEFRFEDADCVKQIRNSAFSGCRALRAFVWPRHVAHVPDWCFRNCQALSEFQFADANSVKEIGQCAFSGCNLSRFVWPCGVEKVPYECFRNCQSLSHLQFEGTSVKSIGNGAFQGCRSLKSIALPHTVQVIERNSLSDCPSLEELVVEHGSALRRDDFMSSGISKTVRVIPRRSTDLRDWIVDIRDLKDTGRKIGSGGSSRVQLFKRKDGRMIAGKFFDGYREQAPQDVEKYCKRELKIAVKLWHPCIVEFEGYSPPSKLTDNKYVLFTRYMPGGSLHKVIQSHDSWFDSTRRTIIVCGIVLAMKYWHSQGVVHTDLKPLNVLLDENHYPYVCDFGSGVAEDIIRSQPCTSLNYTAPELVEDDPQYDPKNDVFSFGIMLYEIVTGEQANPKNTPLFILQGNRPKIPDGVSELARSLIVTCWSQEIEPRPTSEKILSRLKRHRYRLFADVDSDAVQRYVDMIEQQQG